MTTLPLPTPESFAYLSDPSAHSFVPKDRGNYYIWNNIPSLTQENVTYRSIITSKRTGKLLCMSPIQSLEKEDFVADVTKTGQKISDLEITEMIEGTMINLFYDDEAGHWEIATKSGVGGHYRFQKQNYHLAKATATTADVHDKSLAVHDKSLAVHDKSFREMFLECVSAGYQQKQRNGRQGTQSSSSSRNNRKKTKLSEECGEEEEKNSTFGTLEEIPLLKSGDLSPNYCYSFVMQHPDNHIIYDYHRSQLYLIAMFHRVNDTAMEYCPLSTPHMSSSYRDAADALYANTIRAVPYRVKFATNELDALPTFAEQLDQAQRDWWMGMKPMGWCLQNPATQNRHVLENPSYNYLKELRGNHPNLQYLYLSLMLDTAHLQEGANYRNSKLSEYLMFFPQYESQFRQFRVEFEKYATKVYKTYVSFFIMRQRELRYPRKYFTIARRIHHEVFLPHRQFGTHANPHEVKDPTKPFNVSFNVTRHYLKSLKVGELYHLLNMSEDDEQEQAQEQEQEQAQDEIGSVVDASSSEMDVDMDGNEDDRDQDQQRLEYENQDQQRLEYENQDQQRLEEEEPYFESHMAVDVAESVL